MSKAEQGKRKLDQTGIELMTWSASSRMQAQAREAASQHVVNGRAETLEIESERGSWCHALSSVSPASARIAPKSRPHRLAQNVRGNALVLRIEGTLKYTMNQAGRHMEGGGGGGHGGEGDRQSTTRTPAHNQARHDGLGASGACVRESEVGK